MFSIKWKVLAPLLRKISRGSQKNIPRMAEDIIYGQNIQLIERSTKRRP